MKSTIPELEDALRRAAPFLRRRRAAMGFRRASTSVVALACVALAGIPALLVLGHVRGETSALWFAPAAAAAAATIVGLVSAALAGGREVHALCDVERRCKVSSALSSAVLMARNATREDPWVRGAARSAARALRNADPRAAFPMPVAALLRGVVALEVLALAIALAPLWDAVSGPASANLPGAAEPLPGPESALLNDNGLASPEQRDGADTGGNAPRKSPRAANGNRPGNERRDKSKTRRHDVQPRTRPGKGRRATVAGYRDAPVPPNAPAGTSYDPEPAFRRAMAASWLTQDEKDVVRRYHRAMPSPSGLTK